MKARWRGMDLGDTNYKFMDLENELSEFMDLSDTNYKFIDPEMQF